MKVARRDGEKFRATYQHVATVLSILMVLHCFILYMFMFEVSSESVVYYWFDSSLKQTHQALSEQIEILEFFLFKGFSETDTGKELIIYSTLGNFWPSSTMVKRFALNRVRHNWLKT